MPEKTLEAFADHGTVGEPLPADGGDAEEVLRPTATPAWSLGAGGAAPGGGQGGLRQLLDRPPGLDRATEGRLARGLASRGRRLGALEAHYRQVGDLHLRDLFAAGPRARRDA